MHVATITPPDQSYADIIDVVTVRERLQVGADITDESLLSAIQAAISEWDGPEGDLGRAIGVQTLELQAAHFPGHCWVGHPHYEHHWHHLRHRREIILPFPDVITVSGVAYIDTAGTSQTVDPSQYIVEGRKITPAFQCWWPATLFEPGSVLIQYQAGYVAGKVPPRLIQAILLRVQQALTMNRPNMLLKQDTVIGVGSQQFETQADILAPYDRTVERLLGGLKVFA